MAPQTGTVEQFLSAKNGTSYVSVLVAKFGPARTTILAKMETYSIFQALKLI